MQITQPYGILLSPLLLPSCLSLQEEEDHLHSPPLAFPFTYGVFPLPPLSPFFPPVFSLVIPVFLLSPFVCLLSSLMPKLTGWVHFPLCSLSADTAAIKAALMATSPCLTCASHSGHLMDTLLFCLLSVQHPSVSDFHPLVLPVFTSLTPNLSPYNTSYKMLLSAR